MDRQTDPVKLIGTFLKILVANALRQLMAKRGYGTSNVKENWF
jgi:hypothetical protein